MINYKPLPNNITIKKSKIEGLGLFATEDIKQGTNLGISHIMTSDGSISRTPLGGFYNHSDIPNCYKIRKFSKYYLIAEVDIKKGKELTCKYTFYKINKL